MEQLGELEKVANLFGYGAVPATTPKEHSAMTETALRELVRQKIGEAVAKLKATKPTGGRPMLQDYFKNAASYNKKQAKANTAVSDAHNELARAAEARGDFSSAKSYRASADGHLAMAQNHSVHVEQLSTLVNGGPDVWGLAATTIDAQGRPINDTGKMGKGAADDFFSKFVYGEPVDCSGGLFGSGPAKLAKTDQSPSGGLFG